MAKITPKEDLLEGYVVTQVKTFAKSRGFIHRKVVYAGRRGAPDDWFFGPNGTLIIIEFKKYGKAPTEQQFRELKRLTDLGFDAHYIDDIDAGKALFKCYSHDII
jgi:hypothetical protein